MIDVALTWEENQARDALYFAIANHMKKCYLNWNKDTVDDKVIFKHLIELSKGEIDLTDKEESLSEIKDLLRKRKPTTSKGSGKSSNKPRQDYKKKNYKSN